jgi:hypothetical protein
MIKMYNFELFTVMPQETKKKTWLKHKQINDFIKNVINV